MLDTIWARLDTQKVDAALAAIKANFGGSSHLKFVGVFEVTEEENRALREVAGSAAVREVAGIFRDVDQLTDTPGD